MDTNSTQCLIDAPWNLQFPRLCYYILRLAPNPYLILDHMENWEQYPIEPVREEMRSRLVQMEHLPFDDLMQLDVLVNRIARVVKLIETGVTLTQVYQDIMMNPLIPGLLWRHLGSFLRPQEPDTYDTMAHFLLQVFTSPPNETSILEQRLAQLINRHPFLIYTVYG